MFQLCFHIAEGHIPLRVACVFRMAHLLTMTKLSSGVHPIIVGETLYWFTIYVLCLQFHDAFTTHFSLHQFGITTKGCCESIIHDIICILELHFNLFVFQLDIINNVNPMSRGVIFQKVHTTRGNMQLIPFVCAFYAIESPLFHSHLNRENNVIIIPSAMGPIKVIIWEGHYSL